MQSMFLLQCDFLSIMNKWPTWAMRQSRMEIIASTEYHIASTCYRSKLLCLFYLNVKASKVIHFSFRTEPNRRMFNQTKQPPWIIETLFTQTTSTIDIANVSQIRHVLYSSYRTVAEQMFCANLFVQISFIAILSILNPLKVWKRIGYKFQKRSSMVWS